MINPIAATIRTGLKVHAQFDERSCPKAIKVTDVQLTAVNLRGDIFHPEWNHTIEPRS